MIHNAQHDEVHISVYRKMGLELLGSDIFRYFEVTPNNMRHRLHELFLSVHIIDIFAKEVPNDKKFGSMIDHRTTMNASRQNSDSRSPDFRFQNRHCPGGSVRKTTSID